MFFQVQNAKEKKKTRVLFSLCVCLKYKIIGLSDFMFLIHDIGQTFSSSVLDVCQYMQEALITALQNYSKHN